MNKIKLDYLQPGCKILVVRFEGVLMESNSFSSKGTELMTIDSEEDF